MRLFSQLNNQFKQAKLFQLNKKKSSLDSDNNWLKF